MFLRGRNSSLLVFGIVGGVLIALLISGILFLRQKSDQPLPISQQPLPQVAQPEARSGKNVDGAIEVSDDGDKATPGLETNTPTNATELPKTGFDEILWTLLAIGLLSFMTVGYIQSYRLKRRLLTWASI